MRTRSIPMLRWTPVLAALALAAAGAAAADTPKTSRTGKEVVDAVCAQCHAIGRDGAPKIGDARAWSRRTSQGLTALTTHALEGIRKMPAHGGNAGVNDVEIQRAITYMVNLSGGRWVEPRDPGAAVTERNAESVVMTQCATCHLEGKEGAPKIGDRAAWTARMSKGLEALVASAIHGHGPMPPRGGMPELGALDIRAAVLYMFNYGQPAPQPAPPVLAADPYHRSIAGTDIYFGLMRAEAVSDAQVGAAPGGKGYYHLNLALADTRSHQVVKDATVTMQVSDGMTRQTRKLRPVIANQSVSYGEYFRFDSGNAYNIVAQIQRPGVASVIEAKFEFRAP